METIKETKEALIAANLLTKKLVGLIKKHAGVSEYIAVLMADTELKDALVLAYEDISKIPAEIKDITMAEGIELAMVQIQMLPDLIDAFKS